jgi:hypothetical protein
MSSDLSSYKVANLEVSSSTKYDNFVQKVQDTFNAIGDTNLMTWAAGKIITLAQVAQGGASSGQVLAWNGTDWAPANAASGVTYPKTTAKTVNTTVSETDLLNGEITIGAGVLGTTGVAELTAFGDFLNDSGSNQVFPRWKLKLGGTTLVDSGTIGATWGTAATRLPWRLSVEICNLGAANSQAVYVAMRGSATNGGAVTAHGVLTTGEGTYFVGYDSSFTLNRDLMTIDGFNTAAVDTSAAKLLEFTVTLPVSSANVEAKLYSALVKVT